MISLAVERPDPEARARDTFLGVATTAWLGYTYLYPVLSIAHTTLPTCPFLLLTGHPCPFCGGTRSFSAMWRGDILHAARLYPLGPLFFALTFPVAAYGIWALVSGRSLSVTIARPLQRTITVLAVLAILGSWSLKLFWLGN
ncbi:MAG: DUF2752 domain-containing protein [Chloroflexi bacterium]|nr:MAG: DUF2752 domain-containing protein [Chloroflexota bacterium]